MERIHLQARLNALAGTGAARLPLSREVSVADFFEGVARESRSPYPRWVLDQLKIYQTEAGEPLSGSFNYINLTARALIGARQDEADGEQGAMTKLLYQLIIEPFVFMEGQK